MEPNDYDGLLERALRTALQGGVGGLPSVPGYALVRVLGRGAAGVVYLARQNGVAERQVALKVLAPEVVAVPSVRLRFRREIRTLAQLRHPAIVTIHDVVDADGVLAYAMELVEGRTLADSINELAERDGPSAVKERIALALDIGVQIGRALAAVHSIGFVHRDLKPSNILVRRDGTALLSDFGLARDGTEGTWTELGSFVGTVAYSAPEQLRGKQDQIDARSDVYSFGATLYHLLAGRLPWPTESAASALEGLSTRKVDSLRGQVRAIPRDLETIVTKALALAPADRYATAASLADDLERLREGRPVLARRAGLARRGWRALRRNRGLLAAASSSALVAALAVSLVALQMLWVPGHVERKLSEARAELLHHALDDFAAPAWGGDAGVYAQEMFQGDWDLESRLQRAEAAYDDALILDGRNELARRERRVVQYATALAVKDSPPPRARTAALDRFAASWKGLGVATSPDDIDAALAGLHSADLRDIGLIAYVLCDATTCMAAWELAFDALGPEDALVEAARGVVLHEQGRHALAHSRLRDAARRFPNVGFLEVRLAECSLAIGDVHVAREALNRATRLGRHDTYHGLERTQGDLAAFDGDSGLAADKYRVVLSRHNGKIARRHWSALAELEGDWERSVSAYFELVRLDEGELVDRVRVGRAARAWWNSLDGDARIELIATHPVATVGPDGGPPLISLGFRFADLPGAEVVSLAPTSMDPFEVELRRAWERQWQANISEWPVPRGPELQRLYACQRLLAVPRRLSVPLRPENRRLLALIALASDTWWEGARRTTSKDLDGHYARLIDLGFSLVEARVLPWLRRVGSHSAEEPWPRADRGLGPGEHTRIGTSVVALGDPDRNGLGEFAVAGDGLGGAILLFGGGVSEPRWRRAISRDDATTQPSVLLRVPDRDGDDWPEILVGLPAQERGRVVLLSGQKGSELLVIHGFGNDKAFGASLALAADRDGDGHDDYIVGVPGHWVKDPAWPEGRVALHSSRDGAALDELFGERRKGQFGHRVLALPPRTGHMEPQLVASQYGWREPGLARVLARPWQKAAGAWGIPIHPDTDAPVGSLASTDLNADGVLDLLVGERGWGRFLHSRVVAADGRTGGILWSHVAPPGEHMGRALAVLPDLDGDGTPELATSAIWSQERPSGYVSIRCGRTGVELNRLSPSVPTLWSAFALAWVDDQDGDGFGDLLVGSPFDSWRGADAGAVFVISGAALLDR